MNKQQAKQISKSGITVGQIQETLKRAYDAGAANEKRATVNKGFSKAVVFNIQWGGFKNDLPDKKIVNGIDCLAAQNVIREFGDYWDGETPEAKRPTKPPEDYFHKEAVDIYAVDE